MINKTRLLPNATGGSTWGASGTGLGVDVSDMGEKDIFAWAQSGTFSASIQIQVSAAGGPVAPGTSDPSWTNLGAAIAAAGTAHSLVRANWMRAVVTWTSGTIEVAVVGDVSHEVGGRRVSG